VPRGLWEVARRGGGGGGTDTKIGTVWHLESNFAGIPAKENELRCSKFVWSSIFGPVGLLSQARTVFRTFKFGT
jgi:hypothetical protein